MSKAPAAARSGFALGTGNQKQLKILAVLGLVAMAIFAYNFFAGSDAAPTAATPHSVSSSVPPLVEGTRSDSTALTRRRGSSRADLRPMPWRLGPPKAGTRDTSRIDPTLRLDLLARLQSVDAAVAGRNLFQLGAAPVPVTAVKVPPKIHPQPAETAVAVVTAPPTPPAPVAPPIDLKYYGFTTAKGEARRKAFLLDGEDIIMAFEGETVKRRYRVVKVNATSIVMEDTQFKSTQTLPLQPENNG